MRQAPLPAIDLCSLRSCSEEKYTGYVHTCGIPVAREAVARRFTSKASPLTKDVRSVLGSCRHQRLTVCAPPQDVYITSGASGALDIAIGVLCSRGSNILIPAPGFPLYETHARNKSIGCKFYKLVVRVACAANVPLRHLTHIVTAAASFSLSVTGRWISPIWSLKSMTRLPPLW